MVFRPATGSLHQPLAELAEHAHATFWPRRAIQAFVAGAGGVVLAVVAYALNIPIVSGIGMLIGLFLAAMAVLAFLVEGREWLRRRGR